MDIMDSSDTPEGGMNDRPTASSTASLGVRAPERDLPLSVDEDNLNQPTHSIRTDTLESGTSGLDLNAPDGLPTSTDDLPAYNTQHVAPSGLSSALGSIKSKVSDAVESVEKEVHSAAAKLHHPSTHPSSATSTTSTTTTTSSSLNIGNSDMPIPRPDDVLDTDISNPDPDPGLAWSGNHTGTAQLKSTNPNHYVSNTRDAHLSGGLVTLPSHANERQPAYGERHVTDNERRAVDAAAAVSVEPKDQTAGSGSGGGLSGMLNAMGEKVGSGVEMLREKVDSWRGEGSAGTERTEVPADPPATMINKNDPHMAAEVHARSQQGQTK